MAQPTEKSQRLAELVRRSEASRAKLSEAHGRMKRALDLPSRIRASVKEAPAKWLGGSVVAGLATSFLFRMGGRKTSSPKKAIKKERSFLFGLLALAFAASKPFAKIYASKLLKDYLMQRFAGAAYVQDRPARLRVPPYPY